MLIKQFDDLPVPIANKMESGLEEYEKSQGIDVNFKPIVFAAYDDKNQVIAVLDAFSSYSCVHIRDLWVDKSQRGKGIGRQLLNTLEEHFTGKGFHNINTVSCVFQAPDFYKKCGYEVEFVRENTQNPKLTMIFFIKHLV